MWIWHLLVHDFRPREILGEAEAHAGRTEPPRTHQTHTHSHGSPLPPFPVCVPSTRSSGQAALFAPPRGHSHAAGLLIAPSAGRCISRLLPTCKTVPAPFFLYCPWQMFWLLCLNPRFSRKPWFRRAWWCWGRPKSHDSTLYRTWKNVLHGWLLKGSNTALHNATTLVAVTCQHLPGSVHVLWASNPTSLGQVKHNSVRIVGIIQHEKGN